MKKILLGLVISFLGILHVQAYTLKSVDLPYYVMINNELINVKKVYIEETGEVVFNTSYTYNLDNDFTKSLESELPSKYKGKLYLFKNASYYGYQSDPTDFMYFITQVVIWKLSFSYNVTIVDEYGNSIDTYKSDWVQLFEKTNNHVIESAFFTKDYVTELGETSKFQYSGGVLVFLDNPEVDGLTFKNEGYNLYITSYKVGEYSLTFTKTYTQETYSYSDGTSMYWQNLGGPQNLSFGFNYTVKGSKVTINETYEGVNGLYGDAIITSSYELYDSNNEYLGILDNSNYLYVQYNSDYVLKDVSTGEGYIANDDIEFSVVDDDYVINITRYVISKTISVNVLDDNTYNVYLKSNNELYAVVDKSTNVITLPYGTYYIKGDNYYYEFSVMDDEDVVFDIETTYVVEENDSSTPVEENNVTSEVNNSEEINSTSAVEDNEENNTIEEVEVEIVNPQTGDDIFFYIKLALFIIACITLSITMVVL